jgi:hypothetical protein
LQPSLRGLGEMFGLDEERSGRRVKMIMKLVNSINTIQDNLEVTTTSHFSMQVTSSLQSLLHLPSPVASLQAMLGNSLFFFG